MGDSCHEQILSLETTSLAAPNVLSGALLPWRQSYELRLTLAFLNLRFSVMSAQPYTVMEPCQVRKLRLCKISYRSAAAAALTPSDSTLPSSGSAIS
jgi:hypothetical protein